MTGRPTNIRWRVFLILALASFVSYMLRSNVSIAAPAMIRDLHLSEIQFGWILAAFTAGYAIFQFPGGVFGDSVGPRKALTIVAVFWSVLTLLTAAVPGPDVASIGVTMGALMLVRFLVGAVHAPIYPLTNCTVSRWFPVGSWALPHGLSSTALTLGLAATAPLLPWLIDLYDWRISFLIITPGGLLVAVIWWWYARDRPAEHDSVNDDEFALISAAQPPPVADLPPPPGWVRVLKSRNVLLLTMSYFCMNFVFYEAFNWFYYYLAEVREFDPQTAGFLTSSQWIAGGAGAALGGWLCDRWCHIKGIRWGCRMPIIVGMTASAILLFVGAFHPNAVVAVALLAACFFFNQMTEGSYWATSIAVSGQFAGASGGVMNTGGNAVGVLNALIVPWFAARFGWEVAIASGGAFALLGALLLLFVRPDRPLRID